MFEVEQKFPLAEAGDVLARLAQRNVTFAEAVEQVDRYFAHPARDFAATDEALRIRRTGDENRITYKGPKLERTVKTRREIELPLPAGADQERAFTQLLEALGFRPVAEVRKRRRYGRLVRAGRTIEVVLDDVEQVGRYLELETLAPESQLDEARAAILALAGELGLASPERRSYLEMLLAGTRSG